ncbi:MAG: O-antigen ligase family protein, partial [Bacteroidales bacterium]|nr:O-antigen ligase family protein [Bacteroidales bacterium]
TNSSSISPNGSFNQRKFIYLNIHKLILKSPIIGYGTGDVKEELDSFYQENNTYFGKYLNAHNQYFQTLLSIGIIGLIPLLLMLIIPTYISIKHNKPHITAIIMLIALSLMFESMLERQMGVQGIIIIYLILILDLYIIDKKRT